VRSFYTPFPPLLSAIIRVKALASLRIALPTSSTQQRESTTILTTISSDGKVLLYDLFALHGLPAAPADAEEMPQLSALAEYDSTGSRLTCLTMAEDLVTSQQIAIPANDADAAGSSDVGGAEDRDGTDSIDSDAEGDAEEEEEET
jgi:protein MAK11